MSNLEQREYFTLTGVCCHAKKSDFISKNSKNTEKYFSAL
jgi:hypothetical protein